MLHVLWSIPVGFVVVLMARVVMPGMQHMGFGMTAFVGVGGFYVGEMLARLFAKPKEGEPFHPAGLLLSVAGPLIVLFVVGKMQ